MIKLFLLLVFVYCAMTFFGWVIHWSFHRKWMGRFYRAHMNHHIIQYPPEKFYSETYRSAGKDNSVYLFVMMLLPIVIGITILSYMYVSLLAAVFVFIEIIMIGVAHNEIHDHMHLTKTWMTKYSIFSYWRAKHIIHHKYMQNNLGIFTFFWDVMLGTYK